MTYVQQTDAVIKEAQRPRRTSWPNCILLLVALYVISFVPVGIAVDWLHHWGFLSDNVDSALRMLYAPMLWLVQETKVGDWLRRILVPLLRPLEPPP